MTGCDDELERLGLRYAVFYGAMTLQDIDPGDCIEAPGLRDLMEIADEDAATLGRAVAMAAQAMGTKPPCWPPLAKVLTEYRMLAAGT